jgi:hypothetical protein
MGPAVSSLKWDSKRAPIPCFWLDVGYVVDGLDAHDTEQSAVIPVRPEDYAIIDFVPEFFLGHVWFSPAVGWDGSFIDLGAVVDDGPDLVEVAMVAAADHGQEAPEGHQLSLDVTPLRWTLRYRKMLVDGKSG